MNIRVFEAFAGYGSQSIALELLAQAFPDFQFQTVGISEIDKYAIKAYRALHGDNIPNHGDITKIDWAQTADFDLLTYSFPCQDISSAGKQRGFSEGSGTRSSLLWACAEAIEKKRPRFLLMENVKALAVQKKFSADFRLWREWLTKHGYTNYYAVLNAKDYGVPQNRERVFMVSFLGEHTPFYFPAPFELTRRLKHILEDEVDEKYWLKQEQTKVIIKHMPACAGTCGFRTGGVPLPVLLYDDYNSRIPRNQDIIGTITTNEGKNAPRNGHKIIEMDEPKIIGYTRDNKGHVQSYHENDVANTLHGSTGSGGNTDQFVKEPTIIMRPHGYFPGGESDIAPTVKASAYADNNFVKEPCPVQVARIYGQKAGYRIRKLTPRECFRLMDVPEHHIDRLLSAGISNSQLYKLAGNSIVVACLYHIFRKMFCETARESGSPIARCRETPEQLSLF